MGMIDFAETESGARATWPRNKSILVSKNSYGNQADRIVTIQKSAAHTAQTSAKTVVT